MFFAVLMGAVVNGVRAEPSGGVSVTGFSVNSVLDLLRSAHASDRSYEIGASYFVESGDADPVLDRITRIVPEGGAVVDGDTGAELLPVSRDRFFVTKDSLRYERRWVTTAGVTARRTSVECWTPTATWSGRLEGGSPPVVSTIEPMTYADQVEFRNGGGRPWSESRAIVGEYLEAVRFVSFLLDSDEDAWAQPGDEGEILAGAPGFDLTATIDGASGELERLAWAVGAVWRTVEFEGRFAEPRLPARYPRLMRLTHDPADAERGPPPSTAVFVFAEPRVFDRDAAPLFDPARIGPGALLAARGPAGHARAVRLVRDAEPSKSFPVATPSDPMRHARPRTGWSGTRLALAVGGAGLIGIGFAMWWRRRLGV